MQLRNIVNFLYYYTKEKNEKPSQKPDDTDQKTMDKILQTLANQSMREKNVSLEELEGILQNAGMAAWDGFMSPREVDDIHGYVISISWDAYKAQQAAKH